MKNQKFFNSFWKGDFEFNFYLFIYQFYHFDCDYEDMDVEI